MFKKFQVLAKGASKVKDLIKGKKQKTTGTEVVQPFKFKPARSKLEKSVKNLQIATAKESGKIKGMIQKMESDIEPFRRKLRQTTQKLDKKPVTESGFNKGKNLKKGGRVGLKAGTSPFKKKSNVDKIKKTFGSLSVRAGIDNNPNPTYADKIAGAKMKNKKKKVI